MITSSRRFAVALLAAIACACGSRSGDGTAPAAKPLATAVGAIEPPTISPVSFDQPFVARPPEGPDNDVTGRSGSLRFLVRDPGCDPSHPPTVMCHGTAGGSCACAPAGGTTYACEFPFAGAPGGMNTVVIDVLSASGRTATAAVSWEVDDRPPDLTFGAPPYACTTGGGAFPVEPATGRVELSVFDANGFARLFCTLEREGVPVLDEAACSAGAGDLVFDYAGLADGLYTLTVTVVDLVENAAIGSFSWFVDGTPPLVVHLSPADPGAGPVDIVAPDVSPTGTFAAVADPSDQPPVYQCAIDGVPQACSPDTGYGLAGLAEGRHTVQITGTDCVGNVTPPLPVPFDVDLNPPVLTLAEVPADPGPAGSATFEVAAQDAITNVESVACALDDPLADPVAPCPGLVGLPTALHQTTFASLATFDELSPGEHLLALRAVDHWGHASAVLLQSFYVSYSAVAPGGLVAIGQDYAEAGGTGSGPVTTAPAEKVLGNAAFLARASSFARPIRALLVDLGSPPADRDPQVEHVTEALCRRVSERHADLGRSCGCGAGSTPCVTVDAVLLDPASAAAQLRAALLGADVLVLLDQDGVGEAVLAAVGSDPEWTVRLRAFAERGGIVVVTNGTDAGGTPNATHLLVSGLVDLRVADAATGGLAFLECHSRDPLAFALTSLDDTNGGVLGWPESWVQPGNAVRFVNGDLLSPAGNDTNEIYESEGVDCPAFPCPTLPVVVHKYFPARADVGPFHVFASEIASELAGAGSVQRIRPRSGGDTAIFQRPGDGAGDVVFCPLHGDGTISHEMSPGGIVTIARGNASGEPSHRSFSPGLESLHGVGPQEVVVIGLTGFDDPSLDAPASVAMPVYPGAHHYRVSSGCEELEVPDPGAGSPGADFALAFGDRCAASDDPARPFFVVAAAADANGEVLAFNTASGPPPQGGAFDPTWRGWISEPYRLVVQAAPAFDPAIDPLVEEASVAVAVARRGLLFDEAVPPDESALPWTPRFPSELAMPVAGGVRLELRLSFRPGSGGGTSDATSYRRSEAPPGADRIVDVPAGQLLPRLTGASTSGTPGVDGVASWSVDARTWGGAETSLDVADADGEVVLQPVALTQAGAACPERTLWLHMATPAAERRTSLAMPLLPPGALACLPSAVEGTLAAYFSSSAAGKGPTRRAFADHLPDPIRVAAYGGAGVIAAPRRAAEPGTVERFTYSLLFGPGGPPGSSPPPSPPPSASPPPDAGAEGQGSQGGCGSGGAGPAALLALVLLGFRAPGRGRTPVGAA